LGFYRDALNKCVIERRPALYRSLTYESATPTTLNSSISGTKLGSSINVVEDVL
jgi:hypothetical protein